MLKHENRNRKEATFAVGEHVFLSTINLGGSHFDTTVKKLRPTYCGPFRIIEKVGPYTFKLELPRTMKALHPVFHVSLLWKAIPTPEDMTARLGAGVDYPAPVGPFPDEGPGTLTHDDDGEIVYVIERVIARKKKSRGRGYQYLVKWVGFPDTDNGWITKSDAVTQGALRLLNEFDAGEDSQQTEVLVEQHGAQQLEEEESEPAAVPVQAKRRGRPRKDT